MTALPSTPMQRMNSSTTGSFNEVDDEHSPLVSGQSSPRTRLVWQMSQSNAYLIPDANDGNPARPRSSNRTLGTFAGVFCPVALSMFSTLLFLRAGFVVGQAGILEIMLQLVLAYFILMMTVLSICAISTNGAVEGGGAYYMISRALGPEFGGSIGFLFFVANILACGLYVTGFVEAVLDSFGPKGSMISDGGAYLPLDDKEWYKYLYSSVVLFFCLAICMIGGSMFAKTLIVIFMITVVCTLSVYISIFAKSERKLIQNPRIDMLDKRNESCANHTFYTGLSGTTFKDNFYEQYGRDYITHDKMDFATVFSILFSSVTGILNGANMSGELKDPSKAIPKGTLSAVTFTFGTYFILMVLVGASCDRMEKFALVLFDLDGYTSVIERRHLITDIEPTVSKTLNVRYGRKELFGEILCLNDDKYAIDVFQEKWEKTERAKFLYKEIQKRERLGTSHTGGFLALWPGDEIEVDSNVQRVENHVPEEVAEGTEAMEVIEEASQNENQQNQETSLDPESVEEVYTETVKEGLNGRKITVLYEGAGDPNGIADPQRTPVFVRDLTTDQQDILNQRLNDHRTGKSTKSVNTMDVIIVNTDEEIRELQKKPPTTDASTQTHFTTDISLLEVLLKNSTQILQLLQQLPKRKNPDQLEETNNTSLVEYLQSENIDFLMVQTPKKLNPGQQTSVLSEPVPLNSTELTDLSIQPLSTSTSSPAKSPVSPRYRGLSASPEAHPLSPLSPSPTPVCTGTPSPECSPIFPELCRRVQQTTTTFNSTQIQPSVPSQPFTILNHPIQHFSHPSNLIYNQLYTEPAPSFSSRTSCRPTTECFSAPITEISSNTAPIGNNEIRIAQDVQWEIKNAAQNNTGSFGWKMTRRIFKKEELRGKNFYGRKGKAGLSPRRRHAIEHAILDTYGSNSALTQAVTAINTGIRNLHR